MKLFLFILLSAFIPQTFALKAESPEIHNLATAKGYSLKRVIDPSPEGGNSVSYQILNKKKAVVQNILISDTRFDVSQKEDVHAEKIPAEKCQSALKDLEKQIKKYKFKKLSIDFTACGKDDRRQAIKAN